MSHQSRRHVLRGTLALAGLGLLSGCGILPFQAQRPARVPLVGFLVAGSAQVMAPLIAAFRQGLRELGYVEGGNVAFEERYEVDSGRQLPDLAAELVRLEVDVIFSVAVRAGPAAKQATQTIPIVLFAGDPVASGLVASLAHPGGNITGVTTLSYGLGLKRLELLKESVPGISRVGFLWFSGNAFQRATLGELQAGGPGLGLQVESLEALGPSPSDFETVLEAGRKGQIDALLGYDDPLQFALRELIIGFAARNRIPSMYSRREWVEAGGLMAYGANFPELFRRCATYVDKILRGAKPADLPIEQPTKFDFVINLRTAQALGLSIPPSVLQQATEVIQ